MLATTKDLKNKGVLKTTGLGGKRTRSSRSGSPSKERRTEVLGVGSEIPFIGDGTFMDGQMMEVKNNNSRRRKHAAKTLAQNEPESQDMDLDLEQAKNNAEANRVVGFGGVQVWDGLAGRESAAPSAAPSDDEGNETDTVSCAPSDDEGNETDAVSRAPSDDEDNGSAPGATGVEVYVVDEPQADKPKKERKPRTPKGEGKPRGSRKPKAPKAEGETKPKTTRKSPKSSMPEQVAKARAWLSANKGGAVSLANVDQATMAQIVKFQGEIDKIKATMAQNEELAKSMEGGATVASAMNALYAPQLRKLEDELKKVMPVTDFSEEHDNWAIIWTHVSSRLDKREEAALKEINVVRRLKEQLRDIFDNKDKWPRDQPVPLGAKLPLKAVK